MAPSLVICVKCGCHVRREEPACPHCGADLRAAGARRNPLRRTVEVRRVILSAALVGLGSLGAVSCGGRVQANDDVAGTCTMPMPAGENCSEACTCGSGGM